MVENTKKWEETGRRYRTYIKLEKRLSENTVESYMRDLRQFAHFILRQYDVTPRKVERTMIERYMGWLFERGREKTSQARCLCGIRSFFNFLLISDQIEASPAEFVDTPKFGRHLPDILTTAEIDRIIATVDMRTTKGIRDSAMLEVLYSCGLRVSELTSLRLSDLFSGRATSVSSARATSSGWCRSAPSHATRYSAISKSAAAHVRAKRSYSSTTGAGNLRA